MNVHNGKKLKQKKDINHCGLSFTVCLVVKLDKEYNLSYGLPIQDKIKIVFQI